MKYLRFISCLLFIFGSKVLKADSVFDGGNVMEFYFKINDNEAQQLHFDDVHKITLEHEWLNTSDYFTFTNKHDVRLHFTEHDIETAHFTSPDGKYIANAFFFDRNSDTVIVCIPPLGGEARNSIKFAGIFKEYDVVILEFKKTKNQKPINLAPSSLNPFTIKMLSNIIEQTFTWLTHKKNYQSLIGHGQCYGAWILLQAQVNQNNKAFFNKLILDSCPLSLYSVFNNFFSNPSGILSLGRKDSPNILRKIMNIIPFKSFYQTILESMFLNISAAGLIQEVQVPILLIHGNNDYLVTPEQFESLYQSITHPDKSAFITPFKHLSHSLKSKELYRHYILDFIRKK